ncbi:phosphopantothenoylcysteine decarboxylase-like [Liolophura sinensis]|uniref:phosphopantothenoylcysteine decarboxylase-like n=1 Tax=Liolophura sinensis TaxID=3198878 RepID=UPI003158DF3A
MGDPVLHIELRKWADIFVISPLDANTLAKLANGICDNLLTCIVRAWDRRKPLLFAPAMNTNMFEHPLTSQQISILQGFDYTYIPTICKTLACGDTGAGGMAEVTTIVQKIIDVLEELPQASQT